MLSIVQPLIPVTACPSIIYLVHTGGEMTFGVSYQEQHVRLMCGQFYKQSGNENEY